MSETQRRASRKWRKDHPRYYTKYLESYHKRWRADKKKQGKCIRCGKNKARHGLTGCSKCAKYRQEFSPTIRKLRLRDRKRAKSDREKRNIKCLICGSSKHNGLGWHTDHNHATKRYRGILCNNCNLGLGQFKDSIRILKRAIRYLEDRDGS